MEHISIIKDFLTQGFQTLVPKRIFIGGKLRKIKMI